jgi:hypothetical protein
VFDCIIYIYYISENSKHYEGQFTYTKLDCDCTQAVMPRTVLYVIRHSLRAVQYQPIRLPDIPRTVSRPSRPAQKVRAFPATARTYTTSVTSTNFSQKPNCTWGVRSSDFSGSLAGADEDYGTNQRSRSPRLHI